MAARSASRPARTPRRRGPGCRDSGPRRARTGSTCRCSAGHQVDQPCTLGPLHPDSRLFGVGCRLSVAAQAFSTAAMPCRSTHRTSRISTITIITFSQLAATADNSWRLQVDRELTEWTGRSAVRAGSCRRRHLLPEDVEELARDRIAVEACHAEPPVPPKRSSRIRPGSCPSATRALAAVSTKSVGPHTYTSGRSFGGHATSARSPWSIRRRYPRHPSGLARRLHRGGIRRARSAQGS